MAASEAPGSPSSAQPDVRTYLRFVEDQALFANQPDNANNTIGFRVVCLPQHPSPSEPLEVIPAGAQEGSRPAPVIGVSGRPGLPLACRRTIRTAPQGAPTVHGFAIGAGPAPFFSPQP